MFPNGRQSFIIAVMVLLMGISGIDSSRQSIKDILTIVQRIEEKLDKEDRFREITSIVHLDASVDKVNKKLDGILSLLEGNGLVLPRIAGGSTDSDSGSFDSHAMDDRLDRMERMVQKIANAFDGADFGKLPVIERSVTQLQSDINKKLQKLMNVVTSLYEMNKEIKTNFGGRSFGNSDSFGDPGRFIVENLDELEKNIKEQMSVMLNEIRSEITNLKIAAGGIGEGCNYPDYEDGLVGDQTKQANTNKRSSRRETAGSNKGSGGTTMDNSTLDTIIQSLGRTTNEIKREIHEGIQTIDNKLSNLTERQRLCASESSGGDDDELMASESIRDSRKFDVIDPKQDSNNKRKEKSCSRNARNVDSPASCYDLRKGGVTCDGVYVIFPNRTRAVKVFCDMTTDGGGWTMIMRRGDFGDKMTSFHKNWLSYKNGFGDVEGEFWLGNDVIHLLSSRENNSVLRVNLQSFDGESINLTYTSFAVEDEAGKYRLHVGPSAEAPTAASNSLRYHNNHPFSTFDRKNDPFEQNCAATYKGGWWFNGCYFGFLTGEFFRPEDKRENWQGMLWYDWKGNAALKGAHMMIRPARTK